MIYARDFEWEELALCGYSQTKRAKVFGGWIVRSVRFQISDSHDHATATESSVFIPDPKHEWLMEPKPRNTALDIKIEDLDLSVRSRNCLRLAEIDTLGDLVSRRKDDLTNLKNFGKKSLTELKEQLEKHGLKL